MSSHTVGSILDGKYEVLERLGAGGMGEVYKVRHVHLLEPRVIKILRPDRAADPAAAQRFSQEARIATQIKHPNVAILYDFSRLPDGSFYMVWEHLEGEDVGSWLRQRGPFPLQLAIDLGIQALRGLEAIHTAGVIHRDLSPDNLMITRDLKGRHLLKIIDLGLAKSLTAPNTLEITQAGVFMGKLAYCSPEQAGALQEGTLDRRSDLYSFSVVLYEMVCGLPPFDSENQHGFVFRRLTEEPLPLPGRNPKVKVPLELGRVVSRGLERDRERRFPDAIAYLQALAKVAEQLRQVATQEVDLPRAPAARRPAVPPTPVAATPPPPAPPLPGAAPAPPRRTTGDLSKEEKSELLAQIERAAEASRELQKVEAALKSGQFDSARGHLERLESLNPRHMGLPDLRRRIADGSANAERGVKLRAASELATRIEESLAGSSFDEADRLLAEAEALDSGLPRLADLRGRLDEARFAAERSVRLREAEQLLDRYIKERKQALAQFALETVLELAPNHAKRGDYEAWVKLIGGEVEQLKQAERLAAGAREALANDDFKSAKKALDQIQKVDPSGLVASEVERDLAAAEDEQRHQKDLAARRAKVEELVAARRFEEADRELMRLLSLGLSRVAAESLRQRVDEARREAAGRERAADLERRYKAAIVAKEWMAAREAASELGRVVATSPRPGAMFAEIARLEELQKRQQGIDQGAQQVESFLAAERLGEAELALKILVQLDPQHPRRAGFEERLAALRRG